MFRITSESRRRIAAILLERRAPTGLELSSPSVIEIMRFRLAPGVDEAEFLAADRRVQTEFAYHQPGLMRRTTARGDDGGWIVIDLWRSPGDAEACGVIWGQDPVTAAFMKMLDPASVHTYRYFELD